jgi:hypothetical protein
MNNSYNLLGFRKSASTSTPSASQPKQPPSDFNYSNMNNIPPSLQQAFENLKDAINKKKGILKGYQDLHARLLVMNGLLDKYITNHAITNQNISELITEKEALESERDNLKKQSKPADLTKIAELNKEIEEKKREIEELNQQQLLNGDKLDAINNLLKEATNEITAMYPSNDSDIKNIQDLIDEMKDKLGSVPTAQNPEVKFPEIYNPLNSDSQGGYRYFPSSQIRRRSSSKTKSSSSGSSSSKRRRNKKRTARKNMLGGKRMKKSKSKSKSKSSKRKNHKKH